MAAWIKMSLDMELGVGPGDFVLDGDPATQCWIVNYNYNYN